eukprot:CAMPEP_0184339456 /NCGR_PEP_ID=MMETSP1089-20130417/8115_1 /TAXON_ID=38269 ORGANISM="Gloeochaete wittrockiana, Strain SAG46.84" /NCGR_SAMPLE_ID=MMETSP1089 /ASSEMBLY_ACC=CAM_ASM_000445 /LENGTH=110 /DNA_ID=CAMNT_0026666691 /DNA_START=46 /DNA_END=378 /DNA_ORIENTATION=+
MTADHEEYAFGGEETEEKKEEKKEEGGHSWLFWTSFVSAFFGLFYGTWGLVGLVLGGNVYGLSVFLTMSALLFASSFAAGYTQFRLLSLHKLSTTINDDFTEEDTDVFVM